MSARRTARLFLCFLCCPLSNESTTGNVTRLSALACSTLPVDQARAMLRYVNAIMHIYYLMLSGPLDEEKWQLLMNRGLLTSEEVGKLALQGSPAVVLYSWANQIIVNCNFENQNLHANIAMEDQLGGTRGLAAKQIAYTRTQIPKVYYNAVLFLVNAFLICITVDHFGQGLFACVNNRCANTVTMPWPFKQNGDCGVCIATLTIGHSMLIVGYGMVLIAATTMAEAYGPEQSHYDLGVDLDNLWSESQNVLASMAVDPPTVVSEAKPKIA